MKHIGIVGVSSEGAALCYKTICSEANKILGSHKHPEISLNHHSFHNILKAQREGNWNKVAEIMLDSIKKLEKIGADFVIIPGNSVHFVIDRIKNKSKIPVLSIVDITAKECKERKFKKVGILGVEFTMKKGLYNEKLDKLNIKHMIPDEKDCERINNIIYNEIIPNKVTKKTISSAIKIVKKLKSNGCNAVVLACTELPLIINKENSPLPFIDTTRLLAQKALEIAIK